MAGNPIVKTMPPPSILPACGEGASLFKDGSREQHPQVHISSPGLQVAVVSDSFYFDPLPVARHQRPYQLPGYAGVSGVRIAKPLLYVRDLADLHGGASRDKNWEVGIKQHARLSGVDDIFADAVGQI